MTELLHPPPADDVEAVESWVAEHLGDLTDDPEVVAGPRFRGGQTAADEALATLDVTGYRSSRNEVLPAEARGASAMSPWIRHGLLQLRTVWDAVEDAPGRDRSKYRDELLWQEHARHWYARLGERTRQGTRRTYADWSVDVEPRDRQMACVDLVVDELETDGWLVNQTRMWMASHWSVRSGVRWRDGEDWFFRHLLDGSRAANRLGWQWTTGVGSHRTYGFSRSQVRKRAPELCERCALSEDCPIGDWPDDPEMEKLDRPELVFSDDRVRSGAGGSDRGESDLEATGGPVQPTVTGEPDVVWLTAESLGDADPALAAHPDLPVLFVFDAPLLDRLRLSSKRLVFLAECLADLARRRELELAVGDPVDALADRSPAVTFAPVPGFRRRAAQLDLAALHPWPWLVEPHGGKVTSFTAWRKHAEGRGGFPS